MGIVMELLLLCLGFRETLSGLTAPTTTIGYIYAYILHTHTHTHTHAYIYIHTYMYIHIYMPVGRVGSAARIVAASSAASMSIGECGCLYATSFQAVAVRPASSMAPCTSLYLSHPGSPAAYVSIRQHTSAYALHKLVLVAPRLPCSIPVPASVLGLWYQ